MGARAQQNTPVFDPKKKFTPVEQQQQEVPQFNPKQEFTTASEEDRKAAEKEFQLATEKGFLGEQSFRAALKGATFGLSEKAAEKLLPREQFEKQQQFQETFPKSALGSEIVGTLAPAFLAGTGGAQIAGRLLPKVAGEGLKRAVGRGAIEAGSSQVLLEAPEVLSGDKELKDIVKSGGLATIIGAAIPGIGATGKLVAEKFSQLAQGRALQAAGGMLKDFRKLRMFFEPLALGSYVFRQFQQLESVLLPVLSLGGVGHPTAAGS